ncbi:MAG TPA: HAMP domain-containing sensor histidine kinase [Candidatus Dormibacteraeota bacterium]|nr:HAMP domain-containing sensor histidine kinase [Candidatus Dormibacteraeota bacterium]
MTQAASVAQDLTAVAFVALGVTVAYHWYRDGTRAQAMLAAALVSLAIVAGLGRIPNPPLALSIFNLVLFMLSGFFVLLFRNEFIAMERKTLVGAYVLLAVGIAVGVVDTVFFPGSTSTTAEVLGLLLVSLWALFVGEPIVRFWLASNRLPAVQKTRMRTLSFGFGLLIVVLFVAVLGGASLRSPAATIVIQLAALVSVPAIYVSLMPPTLLRRIWRMAEESKVRSAMQDLLIFSPSRQGIAERGVYWAVRLMGATAGFVIDADGKVVATSGIDAEGVARFAASNSESIVSVPLHLTEGQGRLGIVAGPYTPVFGSEEVLQLRAYANSVAASMERSRVTERMAALEKNKTQFLNLASHELRGPLTVIRGYVSMLDTGMLGQLNERGLKAAGVIAAKVSEMNELIEEMIDAARLEEGAVTLHSVEADLREIVRSAVDVVAPMLESRHRLKMDLPDRRVRVNVDPDRTKTIIANLLSNAIKYSPDGGVIGCQVRMRAGTARVTVSDEGIGIPKDSMPMLFTRFGRVISPQTEHLKGTGLGLFLARQFAQLQGGDITAASVEGKGSTFTLQLPLAGVESIPASQDGSDEEMAEEPTTSIARTD